MSSILRQLDEEKLKAIFRQPDKVLDFVDDEVGASEELDLDKAWHGLHFMLTGTAWAGEEPLCYILSGGEQIGNEEDHDVGYGPARGINNYQVKAFSEALLAITKEEFSNCYDPQKMMALELYPEVWNDELVESKQWLAECFTELQEFVKHAADQDKSLVLWIQ